LGLSAKKVEIDTDNSVAVNMEVVKNAVEAAGKKVVIFGHSKGGIDAS
jgi:hypothetical protein